MKIIIIIHRNKVKMYNNKMLGVWESSQTGLHADRYSLTYVRYYTRNILHGREITS